MIKTVRQSIVAVDMCIARDYLTFVLAVLVNCNYFPFLYSLV